MLGKEELGEVGGREGGGGGQNERVCAIFNPWFEVVKLIRIQSEREHQIEFSSSFFVVRQKLKNSNELHGIRSGIRFAV